MSGNHSGPRRKPISRVTHAAKAGSFAKNLGDVQLVISHGTVMTFPTFRSFFDGAIARLGAFVRLS